MNDLATSPPSAGPVSELVPLANLPPGIVATVADVAAVDGDAVRLKSLGICVGRRVQLVQSGDPLIVRVLGARVGLSARLAAGVSVTQLSPASPS